MLGAEGFKPRGPVQRPRIVGDLLYFDYRISYISRHPHLQITLFQRQLGFSLAPTQRHLTGLKLLNPMSIGALIAFAAVAKLKVLAQNRLESWCRLRLLETGQLLREQKWRDCALLCHVSVVGGDSRIHPESRIQNPYPYW